MVEGGVYGFVSAEDTQRIKIRFSPSERGENTNKNELMTMLLLFLLSL